MPVCWAPCPENTNAILPSYMQIAYMEDREIGENTTVMEYVN